MGRRLSARRALAVLLAAAGMHAAHGALLQDVERDDASAVGGESRYPTPLAMAVMKGDADAVRVLLERGANPRIKGPTGEDALGFARKFNRTDLVPMIECALALGPGERFVERCAKR
jgi:hypothetical protein